MLRHPLLANFYIPLSTFGLQEQQPTCPNYFELDLQKCSVCLSYHVLTQRLSNLSQQSVFSPVLSRLLVAGVPAQIAGAFGAAGVFAVACVSAVCLHDKIKQTKLSGYCTVLSDWYLISDRRRKETFRLSWQQLLSGKLLPIPAAAAASLKSHIRFFLAHAFSLIERLTQPAVKSV